MEEKEEVVPMVYYLEKYCYFKYRDWSNPMHRRILTEKCMYLPSPIEFEGDKLDCQIHETKPDETEVKEKMNETLINLFGNHEFIPKMTDEWYQESPFADINLENKYSDARRSVLEKHIGILSLAKTYSDDCMWENYGGHNKGFCLALDKSAFTTANYPYKFYMTGDVIYEDTPNLEMTDWSEKANTQRFFSKQKRFSYEQEFRCVSIVYDNFIPRKLPLQLVLQAVIMGKDMPEKDKNALKCLVKEHWGPIPTIDMGNLYK